MPDTPCLAPVSNFETRFGSLGDINRAGAAFCAAAHDTDTVDAVQQYRMFRMQCLATTLSIVDAASMPCHALVSVRLKRLDSIRRKISRDKNNFNLGRMDDIIGVRVVCANLEATRALGCRIKQSPEFYRLKDYLFEEHPAGTGYRAIHHIMRFSQPLSETKNINVRFEIQVRSYYQHQWAIWSESQGELVKAGGGSQQVKTDLRDLSGRIAHWEERNSRKLQYQLPVYTRGEDIIVAWRQKFTEPTCYSFQGEVNKAVEWLNYLETKYPAERGNALLLVGITDPGEAQKVLSLTHPLYTMSRIVSPEYWMPPNS